MTRVGARQVEEQLAAERIGEDAQGKYGLADPGAISVLMSCGANTKTIALSKSAARRSCSTRSRRASKLVAAAARPGHR